MSNSQAQSQDMNLDVTVRPITPTENTKNLLAFASVKFNDCFVVEGLKVAMGENGPFVSMPGRKFEKDGKEEFRDTAFPITADFRTKLNGAVLDAYSRTIDKMKDKIEAAEKATGSIKEKITAAEQKTSSQPQNLPVPGKGVMAH